MHSSQTGWHPSRALHPQTAAAGHDNTHAGQCWSRLEGSYGGNAGAPRGAASCTVQTTHAVRVRHKPLVHTPSAHHTGDTKHTPPSTPKTHKPLCCTALTHCPRGKQSTCVLQTWGTSHISHTRWRQDLGATPALPVQVSQELPFLHRWDWQKEKAKHSTSPLGCRAEKAAFTISIQMRFFPLPITFN